MAGHGSPPAPDRAEHPGRKVSNVASTGGRIMVSGRPQNYTVTRLRRERFDPDATQPSRHTQMEHDWNEFKA